MLRVLSGLTRRLVSARVPRSAWGAGVLFLALAAPASAQVTSPTPAGSRITNTAALSWQQPGGQAGGTRDSVVLITGRVLGVDVEPSRAVQARPASMLLLGHTVQNTGNAADSYTVTAVSKSGWRVRLYRDANRNGALDGGEAEVAGPLALDARADAALVLGIQVPAGFRGTELVVITAISTTDAQVSDSAVDTLHVDQDGGSEPGPGAPVLLLDKSVDRTEAQPGDVLTYTIILGTSGAGSARAIELRDTIPAGATYLAGSLRLNGRPFTDAVDGDAGAWLRAAPQYVRVRLDSVASGIADTLVFQASVAHEDTAGQRITNFAVADYADGAGGTHSALSDTVVTIVKLPVKPPPAPAALHIDLQAQALDVAPGETAVLVAEVSNTGEVDLSVEADVQLPQGTRFVPGSLAGADSVEVTGARLRVRLPGNLRPSALARFRYAIAIVDPAGDRLVNRARASARQGTILSNEAVATVRLRRNALVETLTVLGKVFADLNGNGTQDRGEPGIAGVDVWSEDGAVVRSDGQGKFSFVQLRPGSHAVRADPASLPAGYALPLNSDGLVRFRMTGWTSPRVMLPLRALATDEPAPMDAQPSPPPAAPECVLASAAGLSCPPAGARGAPPRKAAADESVPPVRVRVARTADDRSKARAAELMRGPGAQIFAPPDGQVVGTNRIFVGVRAEPGRPVALFRGDTLLEQGTIRGDGVYDFVSMPLRPGPNMLRARVTNSWSNEQWDSIAVHMSGPPAQLRPALEAVTLPADGKSVARVRLRVLDRWGVPVLNHASVTVAAEGASIGSPDGDASSSGVQVLADDAGWATVEVKAGVKVTRGALTASAGAARAAVRLDLVAAAQPFMLIGTGQVGVGAAAEAFGSITGRGRLDERTALTISYDSRRLDDGRDVFARTVDPFSESLYPILGDASERRSAAAARGQFSARLERGFDYLALGDVQTGVTAQDLTLARYGRSLTGAAGQVTTGALRWSGFGAVTSQALRQVQLRGLGTSGPYLLGTSLVAGTDQVQIEVRDRDNAQRVLGREALTPYIDYQIDYATGVVLLKRPLPAADGNGNPVFLMVTGEVGGQPDRRAVYGLRVQSDLAQVLQRELLRGTALGASVVRDAQLLHPLTLVGTDVRVAAGQRAELRAEVAHSDAADSSGLATTVEGRAQLFGQVVSLTGRWTRIGAGFRNPSNLALQGGTSELALGAGLRLLQGDVRLEHARQDFGALGITRERTALTLRQPLSRATEVEARLSGDQIAGGLEQRRGAGGELKLTWMPWSRFKLWGEARGQQWSDTSLTTVGNYVGAGMALQATRDVWLEGRQLFVQGVGSKGYSLTNFGVRSALAGGAQAWGSYQLVGGIDGASNAAVVGLRNRLALGNGWTANGLFERRLGLERSPADDPMRALPFLQREANYWSGGLGLEFLQLEKPYRLSARAEHKDGQAESISLATLAGDVALGGSLAILSRQELQQRETGPAAAAQQPRNRRLSSTWGLALRPAATDRLNGLLELRWLDEENPLSSGTLDRRGQERRLIGAAELIWAPIPRLEGGMRYALRQTRSTFATTGLEDGELRSSASYLGSRFDVTAARWLGLRQEGRLLSEHRSGTRSWDAAGALVFHPIQGIELVSGHRWGNLRDADFAVSGGAGWYLEMAARLTEGSVPSAAAFWRDRFGR